MAAPRRTVSERFTLWKGRAASCLFSRVVVPPVLSRFLLLLLLLLSQPGWAQHRYWDADADSLRRVLSTQRTDAGRLATAKHLIDLARLGEALERKQTLVLLDELFVLNQWTKPEEEASYRALRAGIVFWLQGNQEKKTLAALQQAIALFNRTDRPVPRLLIEIAPLFNRLNLVEERYVFYRDQLAYNRLHGNTENTAACYLSLGAYYRRKGAYNQAVSNFLHAAELFKGFDQRFYINELKVAGANYAEWGNTTKALEYLRQSMKLATQYAQRTGTGVDAYTLRHISQLHLQQDNLTEALLYADFSLTSRERSSLSQLEDRAYGLVQKARVLLQLKQMNQAKTVLQQAQHLADSLRIDVTGRRQGEFELTAAWARYYTLQQEHKAAERYWLAAYREATVNRLNVLRRNYLRQLSNFSAARGNAAQAQQYSRAYMALTDAMYATQGTFHLAQYEGERMEQAQSAQIANLRQAQAEQDLRLQGRTNLLLGALLAIGIISGLGAVVYRQLQANRRTLQQLRQTQKHLIGAAKWAFVGEVSAGIAHELQNPLSFMKQFAEVSTAMIEDMAPQPQGPVPRGHLEQEILTGLKKNLQEISQHGVRASSIIRGMLEHARAGTGKPEPTDMNLLVEEYLRLALQGVQGPDKTFQAQVIRALDPALPPVRVVPQDLGRVLLNVFTNALHAVRQRQQQGGEPDYQPSVRVRTCKGPNHVEIRVADNGIGMSEDVRNRIFEPFFTTKPVGEGTGLGLSLSMDVVKAHSGTLHVETKEGQGTELVLTLPV